MKVRVANATKKDFNLHVALGGIASRDCRRGQRRRFTDGGIGLRFVSSWLHGQTCRSRLNIATMQHRAMGHLPDARCGVIVTMVPSVPMLRWWWRSVPTIRLYLSHAPAIAAMLSAL